VEPVPVKGAVWMNTRPWLSRMTRWSGPAHLLAWAIPRLGPQERLK